jgi:hypothetical protein
VSGRNTQGVKLVNLDSGDIVNDVARMVPEDDEGVEVEGAEEVGVGPDEDEE